jgi:enoyl-CoA hydratase/carnithine racemase
VPGFQDAYGPLRFTVDDGVGRVTIDHPPTNLVDGVFIAALIGLLADLEADQATGTPTVRALLFRSHDPDFFLMHGDVHGILALPTGEPAQRAHEPNVAAATFQRVSELPLVSIGLIDGAARGGGAEFLTALDFRIGTPRTVLGQPEVAMGILPGAGGTSRLPRLLGRGRALDVILTGRDVAAGEAVAIGWLDVVVQPDELEADGLLLARRVAAMPPASVAAVKRVVDVSIGTRDLTLALTAETDAFGRLIASGGHTAPMQRFLDAGGQTRDGEVTRMAAIVDAMLDGRSGA